MTWWEIKNSLTADSSDMNDNFSELAAGSITPRSSAGASFVATNSVYDLGTTTARYRTVYCKNFDELSVTSYSLWKLLSSTEIGSSSASIEFTGLNGDLYDTYMMISKCIVDNGSANILVTFNQDSATNYGNSILGAISATPGTSEQKNSFFIIQDFNGTNGSIGLSKSIFILKSNNVKSMLNFSTTQQSGTTLRNVYTQHGIWNNSIDTVTSIQIRPQSGYLRTSTVIQLWGR